MWRFAVLVLRDPSFVLASPKLRKLQLAHRQEMLTECIW